MKLKQNKKKVIIFIAGLLVILLTCGTIKGYQSFRYDQRQTAMDMNSMMRLFNMQLQLPNKKISEIWTEEQDYQILGDVPFDAGVFSHYMLKKVTYQKIEYKDIEPQWYLLPTQADSKFPNTKSTAECLKNFNDNLLYNPEYEQYRRDVEFSKPLTMDELLNNSKKVVHLINDLYYFSSGKGFSIKYLTDYPCPSKFLPK